MSFIGSSYPTMGQKLNFCHFSVCPFLCGTASEFPRTRSVCRMRCCPLPTSTLPPADSPQHTWWGTACGSLSSSEPVGPPALQPCPSRNHAGRGILGSLPCPWVLPRVRYNPLFRFSESAQGSCHFSTPLWWRGQQCAPSEPPSLSLCFSHV